MKATFTGTIKTIQRPDMMEGFAATNDMVSVMLDLSGNIEDVVLTAKPARFTGTLRLKPIVADKLRFGTKITIIVHDDVEEVIPVEDSDIISTTNQARSANNDG